MTMKLHTALLLVALLSGCEVGLDSSDLDAAASPAQTDFISRPNACTSLDWNCDGSVESYGSSWR